MLSNKLKHRYLDIVDEAHRLVETLIEAKFLSGKIDFAAIFAQNPQEFDEVHRELGKNGIVFDEQKTGNYYLLYEPIITPYSEISVVRVRTFDTDHPEKGYADFQVKNYYKFKNRFEGMPYMKIKQNVHGKELMELVSPGYGVRVYFPKTWPTSDI